MPLERCFLGWDTSLSTRVREYLLPEELSGPVDLGTELVVVQTRQAGRRLRESLALYCEQQNTALLSARVETSDFFLRSTNESTDKANSIEVTAVWAEVLLKADLADYRGLFPIGAPTQDFSWALHTTEIIQQLRNELVDGGYSITGIVENFIDILEEPERWRDLARLETAYLSRFRETGKQDPYKAMLALAENPELPPEIEKVVLAAVFDPTPLMVRALEHIAKRTTVVVLVYAPEAMANYFDDWGRPLAKQWDEVHVDIPKSETNVILSGSPRSQSSKVLQLIAEESTRFGPADIAIGVPDREIIPFLEAELEQNKLPPFNPAGISLSEHPIYQLLKAFRSLVNEGGYTDFSSFLRHSAVIEFLQKTKEVQPYLLLKELDEFQNNFLPLDWEKVAGYFSPGTFKQMGSQQEYGQLCKAVAFIDEQIKNMNNNEIADALCLLLQSVYEGKMLNPNVPDDAEFIKAADKVNGVLRELSCGVVRELKMDKQNALSLLLYSLGQQSYYQERKGAVIDLERWLELPWNDASLMIVTGMNDGIVPAGKLSDIFLPDTLRSQLKLRNDADRLAGDIYLMHALIESRQTSGRICFVVGKTSSVGDPLKPSRLLFRCDDGELPQRAGRLFGEAEERRDNYPPSASFLLKVSPFADVTADKLSLKTMSVTKFKDYLSCPFRFYMKYILGMEELGDEKMELDALDFGSMLHKVLHDMTLDEEMSRCDDETKLVSYLYRQADEWIRNRFGASPPLQVEIQLASAKQRLRAAAHVQVELSEQGWQVEKSELKLKTELSGMTIRGRIDRIDRHQKTGAIRILDYKTTDNVRKPQQEHLGTISTGLAEHVVTKSNGKDKCWRDLQLPLYYLLLARSDIEVPEKVELGYFNLPKAVTDTELNIWHDFNDELLNSARACAEGIIKDVKAHKFWPPSAKVPYDDFEKLFPIAMSESVDVGDFELYMKEGRGEQW